MKLSRREFAIASLAATVGSSAFGQRLPTTREVPWLGEIQTPPAQLPADAPRLLPLLVDAGKNPIRTREHWQKHREYLRREWQYLIGTFKPRDQLVEKARRPPEFTIRESDRAAGVSRQLIH